MKIKVTAPGKIILSGEHSVVYGYKAIASSINLKCEGTINTSTEKTNLVVLKLNSIPFIFNFNIDDFISLKKCFKSYKMKHDNISAKYQALISEFLNDKIDKDIIDFEFIKSGIMVFLDLYLQTTKKFKPLEIIITSQFSYGCGIGSSAAYSTVLATSLMLVNDIITVDSSRHLTEAQLKSINSLSLRGEKIIHGSPSGIDNCISTFGRSVIFQRRNTILDTQFFDLPHLKVILVDTGVKRCTKTVLKDLRLLVENNEEIYHDYFRRIHNISSALENVLTSGHNLESINELVKSNQLILSKLGVSHPAIEEVINILKSFGITGKLTGAGRGGCVYGVLLPGENNKTNFVTDAIEKLKWHGYDASVASLGCPGVEIFDVAE